MCLRAKQLVSASEGGTKHVTRGEGVVGQRAARAGEFNVFSEHQNISPLLIHERKKKMKKKNARPWM